MTDQLTDRSRRAAEEIYAWPMDNDAKTKINNFCGADCGGNCRDCPQFMDAMALELNKESFKEYMDNEYKKWCESKDRYLL